MASVAPEPESSYWGAASINRRIAQDARVLARGELSFCGPNLSVRKSAVARAAETETHQAAAAGTLGHYSWIELHLPALDWAIARDCWDCAQESRKR
jgi:hypothetical protein